MDVPNYYTIGEAASLSSISTRTLRHYDDIDLLKPGFIDEETGYRYYFENQLILIVLIEEWKYRGFSLPEIKKLLNTTDIKLFADVFKEHKNKLDEQIKSLFHIRSRIKKRIKNFEMVLNIEEKIKNKEPEVELKMIPPKYVIFEKKTAPYNLKELASLFLILQKYIKKHNLDVIEPYFIIFNDNYENINFQNTDYELCYALSDKCDLNFKFMKPISGGLYATLIHKGNIKDSIQHYKKLINWIKDNGYKPKGPLIRLFLISYAHTKSQKDIMCEFQVAIEKF